MSNYRKGARAEYELSTYLWEDGWWTVRQAASGAVSHEACDVAAMKDGRVLLFEVKDAKLPIKFDDQLQEAKKRVGEGNVECYYAVKRGPQWMVRRANVDVVESENDLEPIIRVIR